MTSGGAAGTSGGRPFRFEAVGWIAVTAIAIAAVNVASQLIEAHRRGQALAPVEPIIWELSSIILVVALAPLVGMALERLPPDRERIAPFVAGHALLTIPYSLAHVGGMVALREAAYALAGETYEFANGNLALSLLYEWNKDALAYAAILATFGFFRWRADLAAAKAPASAERIEIRDGNAAVFLDPHDVLWVEAAGNYVEFHTTARSHLVRGTLAAWEVKLSQLGFVRAHRSRIVNRSRIRSLTPTKSGDVGIVLDDGREIAGSRRYREALNGSAL